MKNIVDQTAYQEITDRIKLLSVTNTAHWGKMNLPQMLVHCTMQLKMAVGEIPSQPQGSFLLRTAIGKWIAFGNIPWPKGSQTPNEMNVIKNHLRQTDVQTAKTELLIYLDKVNTSASLSPHPFFGKLTKAEWGKLIYKHVDHHLRQFGQ